MRQASSNQQTAPEMEEQTDDGTVGDKSDYDGNAANPDNCTGLAELHAMEVAYRALEPLGRDGQYRAFKWLTEALDLCDLLNARPTEPVIGDPVQSSEETRITPRDFIGVKKPESLVERITCLGYYLARYRGTPHFSMSDIVVLNTEAAAHEFGNPSRDFGNADRQNGYLISAANGKKQLTARGEAMVDALPDREAVKTALKDHPHKPRRPLSSVKRSMAQRDGEH